MRDSFICDVEEMYVVTQGVTHMFESCHACGSHVAHVEEVYVVTNSYVAFPVDSFICDTHTHTHSYVT